LVPGTDEHLLASRFTVDSIIEGLTESTTDESTAATPDVVASGSIEEERGSSDHPPIHERVERFLAGSGHDPWKSLGVASSSGRDLTIWSIAVNAVMAGCTLRTLRQHHRRGCPRRHRRSECVRARVHR
jgi:hypothetical protein